MGKVNFPLSVVGIICLSLNILLVNSEDTVDSN